ncbi:LPS export ABC transporter permease LptF [Chitinilyticum piscinae]|uniref:Lipopolysaccharide export system permease protein LptF n=1 Tax=Chitinilyticum piscinae TaxID=2866724 RepID=A0A8J7FH74_9NEIS|nr:LPS export ABC transporter permease LptF [Chitinilyticum piscinae]MBE9609115.1 LPS export ABC transporter permease LptF [Chitinilyticum piscinae]
MLFRKRLVNEMIWVALGLFVVLLLIVLTTQIVRLLGEAAVGALASSAVWVVMGFAAVRYLPVLLSLMLFVSVLSVMTRLWKDNEMVVWFASGRSIADFIRPVLGLAIPVVALIAAMSLFVSPWAQQKNREFREAALAKQDMTQLSPGVFREAGSADKVYFVENFSGLAQSGNNVFMQIRRNGKISYVLAERGGLHVDEAGDRWVWLKDARAYEALPGTLNYDLLHMAEGRVRLDDPKPAPVSPSTQALPTARLLGSPVSEHQAELHWRLALPIATLILALAAIPLAFFNARGGRMVNILFAGILAFAYYNCMNVAQSWLSAGKIPGWIGMWPLHLLAAALTVWLFWWRSRLRRG